VSLRRRSTATRTLHQFLIAGKNITDGLSNAFERLAQAGIITDFFQNILLFLRIWVVGIFCGAFQCLL